MTDFEEKLMSLGRTYDVRAHNAEVATTLGQALEDFKNDVISLHEATVAEIIGEDESSYSMPLEMPERHWEKLRARAKQPEEGVKE